MEIMTGGFIGESPSNTPLTHKHWERLLKGWKREFRGGSVLTDCAPWGGFIGLYWLYEGLIDHAYMVNRLTWDFEKGEFMEMGGAPSFREDAALKMNQIHTRFSEIVGFSTLGLLENMINQKFITILEPRVFHERYTSMSLQADRVLIAHAPIGELKENNPESVRFWNSVEHAGIKTYFVYPDSLYSRLHYYVNGGRTDGIHYREFPIDQEPDPEPE